MYTHTDAHMQTIVKTNTHSFGRRKKTNKMENRFDEKPVYGIPENITEFCFH